MSTARQQRFLLRQNWLGIIVANDFAAETFVVLVFIFWLVIDF